MIFELLSNFHRIIKLRRSKASTLFAVLTLALYLSIARGELLINEFDYDQPGVDYKEFIEIFNISPVNVSLHNFQVWLLDNKGVCYNKIQLIDKSLPPGGYYVICSTNADHVTPCDQQVQADISQSDRSINLIRNTPGSSIALISIDQSQSTINSHISRAAETKPSDLRRLIESNPTITDSVTYGNSRFGPNRYTQTEPCEVDQSGWSFVGFGLSRCPNGASTHDNSHDFRLRRVSPKLPNNCQAGAAPPSHWPSHPPPGGAPHRQVAYHVLANQWPGSWRNAGGFCTDAIRPWAPAGPMWTVHGLWPNFATPGVYPSNCDPNYPFDVTELDPGLIADMATFWPSFACPGSNSDVTFWTHEWDKHGTCMEGSIDSIEKYFSLVRDLRNQINIYQFLEEANILPGSHYNLTAVSEAVAGGLGFSGGVLSVHCARDGTTLEEIWICVSTALQIISCDDSWHVTSRCKNTVFYPYFEPHSKLQASV